MFQKEVVVQNMEICNKKNLVCIILSTLLIFFCSNTSYADLSFEKLKGKKVSYLDFFLLKYENKLIARSNILQGQSFPTRIQYSGIGVEVDFDEERKQIFTEIHAMMDKSRYSQKKYNQRLSDCNQVRNLIFYRRNGYTFWTQKRDSSLSLGVMEGIFKEVFFNGLNIDEEEEKFLLDNMFVEVKIFHPVNKTELVCSGKVNDYELK